MLFIYLLLYQICCWTVHWAPLYIITYIIVQIKVNKWSKKVLRNTINNETKTEDKIFLIVSVCRITYLNEQCESVHDNISECNAVQFSKFIWNISILTFFSWEVIFHIYHYVLFINIKIMELMKQLSISLDKFRPNGKLMYDCTAVIYQTLPQLMCGRWHNSTWVYMT